MNDLLKDEDIWGAATSEDTPTLSDADIWGSEVSQPVLSDADIWGSSDAPAAAAGEQPVGLGDYATELGRSFVRGISSTANSTARGLGVLTSDAQGAIDETEKGIANLDKMSAKDRQAFYDSLGQKLSPVVAFNYRVGIRKYLKGDKEGAKSYFDTARSYIDTTPVEQQSLSVGGQKLEDATNAAFPQDPRFKGSITSDIGQAGGSSAFFLPIGLLTGGTGVMFAGAAAGADQSHQQAQQSLGRMQRDRLDTEAGALGTDKAEQVALEAGRLGSIPGASEVVPTEIFLEQMPKFIPGLRTIANTPVWGKFAKAFGRIGTQVLSEGGQEAFQQWASNVINKLKIDPDQDVTEGVLYNALLGGVVGGGMQVGVEGYNALRGHDESAPPPDGGPINVSPPPGAPGGPPRIDPTLFPDLASPPPGAQPPGAPPPAQGIPDDAYLLGAGFTAEQISDMNPEERANAIEEARAQGVEPVDPWAAGPEPGAAPMAPRGTRRAKVNVQSEQDLEEVRPTVNAEPTPAQAQAGNYQKGHIKIHGLDVSIENPRGSVRRGMDEDGTAWASPELPADYGYIKGTTGKDGDHVDVYIGPNPQSDRVYVIDQHDLKTGKFDEHKSVLGASSPQEAVDLYVNSFDQPTYDRIGDVTEMSVDEFRQWVKDGKNTKRPAAKSKVGRVLEAAPEVPPADMGHPVSAPSEMQASPESASSNQEVEQPARSTPNPVENLSTAPTDDFDSIFQQELDQQFGAGEQAPSPAAAPPVGTAPRAPKATRNRGPINVLDFIASIGGISDPTGELAGMDLPRMTKFGPVLRKTGLHPDKVREALVEAGLLHDRGRGTDLQADTTENDVYDLLARHMSGDKVYTPQDQAKGDELATTRAAEAQNPDLEGVHPIAQRWGEDVWNKVHGFLDENGSYEDAWSPQEVNDAARMVAGGMDADTAFERAAIMHVDDLLEFPDIAPEITAAFDRTRQTDMLDLPPFPDVEKSTDVAQQPEAPEDRQAVRSPGADGGRPAVEAEARGAGAQVRDAGESSSEEGIAGPASDEEVDSFDDTSAGDAAFDEVGGTKPASEIFPAPAKTISVDATVKEILSEKEAKKRLAEWKAAALEQGKTGENAHRVIISLFDYTGTWSQPYVDAGFTVIQYDIQHIQDQEGYEPGDEKLGDIIQHMPVADILDIRNAGYEIYGILSACPCTTFAASGTRWWKDRHDLESREAVEKVFGDWVPEVFTSPVEYNTALQHATEHVIELANPTGFHVLENPVGRIARMTGMPAPLMRFNPNNYGDPYTKKTQLWGDFSTELPTANVEPTEGSKMHKLRGDNPAQKRERSTTPSGFAYAFFMANNPRVRPGKTIEGAPEFDPEIPVEVSGVVRKNDVEPAEDVPAATEDDITARLKKNYDGRYEPPVAVKGKDGWLASSNENGVFDDSEASKTVSETSKRAKFLIRAMEAKKGQFIANSDYRVNGQSEGGGPFSTSDVDLGRASATLEEAIAKEATSLLRNFEHDFRNPDLPDITRMDVKRIILKLKELGGKIDTAEPTTEKGADAKDQLVIPGAEKASQDEVKAAAADTAAQKELEVRRKQSKLRKSGQVGVEGQEGGLFEEKPARLFDETGQRASVGREQAVLSSRSAESTFAAEFMTELAQVDDLFQYPKINSASLERILSTFAKDVEPRGRFMLSESDRQNGVVSKKRFVDPDGFDFFVLEDRDGQVWIDISGYKPGMGGSAIYAAVATYAHNARKVFIGDPAGLSDEALRRRTEAMLSSALKFGTTRHIEPHPRQLRGAPKLGIPPLKWTYGDDFANVAGLIEASTANTLNAVPELADARYDFASGTFRTGQGQPLTDGMLRARYAPHGAREAGAGSSTLKRAILLNSLLRAEGGARPGLLAQVLRQPDQLVRRGGLEGTLYSRPKSETELETGSSYAGVPEGPFDEAQYLRNFRDADRLRARIAAARSTGGGRGGEEGVSERSPTDEGPQGDLNDLPRRQDGKNPFRFVISQRQKAQVIREINQVAERILGRQLAGVNVITDQTEWNELFDEGEDAVFDPNTGIIHIALHGTQDPRATIRHEAVHALRQAGVINAREWAVLSRMASTRWIDQYKIRDRYETLYRERFEITEKEVEQLLIEEAIADAMADHWTKAPAEDVVSRIFARVKAFLEAVRTALRGHGFTSASQILDNMERGATGRRKPGTGQGRDFLLYARQSDQAPLSARRLSPPRNPAPGSFEAPHDERVRRALVDSTDTILNRLRRAGRSVGTEFRRKTQDREIDLLRTQRAIEQAAGPLAEPQNAYLAASLYPGRVAQRDKDLVDDTIEPLVKDIARRGLSLEEVNDFVMARHAIERNLEVGQLHRPGTQFHEAMTNPAVVGASGLSENDATDILNAALQQGKLADLEAVGDRIVDLNRRTLARLHAEGLVTQEQFDALTQKYQYYVPLRGWDDVTDESSPEGPKTGRRYDVRGKEFQQAFGRASKADNPLAYSILQARQAIIRIEKNRVGKRFLRLVQANPNEAFWEVNRVDLKKVVDENTGYVRNVFDRGAAEAENVYAVKVGGKRYNITLHHEGLLRAMKGIGGENMGDLVGVFHKINRFFAAINTSFDPEFIFRNFLRDVQQAGIVLQEEKARGITAKILASLPKAAYGMNQMLQGNVSGTWAGYAREFADAGGKIGFMDRGDVDREKKNLDNLMREATAGWTAQLLKKANDHTLERLSRYNDTIENTLRLSTYVALRQAGATKDRAAFVARELTVNFNRKGEWGPALNAFYLFFNASMQGAASLFMRLGRSRKMKAVAAGIIVEAFLMDTLNRMIGGDDDDDKNRYDKISPEEKARNHIFMMPKWVEDQYGVPYFKIPLPLGWNWFNVVGQQASSAVAGAVTPLEAFGNIAGTFADSFNPLGSGGFLSTFAPTLLDPAVEIGTNRDFFGESIVPRVYDETTPYAERYKPNVDSTAKWLTDTLSRMTGGSPERPGAIDWSPEWVEHLADFAFGGLGRFFTRSKTTLESWLGEGETDAGKVPFQRVFVGRDSTFADRDEYFQIRDAVHITERELKGRIAEHDKEAADAVRTDHAREVKMIPFMDTAEKMLTKLRKEYKAVKNAQSMGEAARAKRLETLGQKMDEIQRKVRTRWHVLGKNGETAH